MLNAAAPRAPAASRSGAPAEAPAAGQLQQFLGFALGDHLHALRIEQVREILEVAQMTPLPLTPGFVLGVMNLRGIVVPVIDLAARLGLPAATIRRRSCVMLLDAPPGEDGKPLLMGALVDAVQEVFDVASDASEAPPRLGLHVPVDFVRSIVRLRGRATTELDLAAVLDPRALGELITGHGTSH